MNSDGRCDDLEGTDVKNDRWSGVVGGHKERRERSIIVAWGMLSSESNGCNSSAIKFAFCPRPLLEVWRGALCSSSEGKEATSRDGNSTLGGCQSTKVLKGRRRMIF